MGEQDAGKARARALIHLRQFQSSRLLSANQFIGAKDESLFSDLVSAAQSPSVPKPPDSFFATVTPTTPTAAAAAAGASSIAAAETPVTGQKRGTETDVRCYVDVLSFADDMILLFCVCCLSLCVSCRVRVGRVW